jgi:hypothetical protein
MKAGSHVDLASVFDAPTVDGLTTLGVLAFDAGEPVTDDPITLGSRVWREIGPGGDAPPPITAALLGSLPAFAITYDGATGEAPIRTLYRGAAVGSWVVVAQCSGAGPAAIAGLDAACGKLVRSVELADAPRVVTRSAATVAEAGSPYTFAVPDGFAATDPAVVRAQLGGAVPGSLVLRSWENRVLVFASDAGRRLTSISPDALCGVVQKVLPRTSTTPAAGRASAATRGRSPTRPAARCPASRSTRTGPSTARSCWWCSATRRRASARPRRRAASRCCARCSSGRR